MVWEYYSSRLSPVDFENKNCFEIIKLSNNKQREIPIRITNDKIRFAL
jgi:hypothetical protein